MIEISHKRIGKMLIVEVEVTRVFPKSTGYPPSGIYAFLGLNNYA